VFIDIIGMPLTPQSFAGARRRLSPGLHVSMSPGWAQPLRTNRTTPAGWRRLTGR
jgi:hypothetical protein